MARQWIKNTDKEVEFFHPVCIKALSLALKNLKLDRLYVVQHHRRVGTLEMDLVIANKDTDKILCVVEVKRTISAVYSTRYQFQAMSYVQSLRDALKESQYYILTNLECSALFKYDKERANVYEQLVEPGIEVLHKFADVDKEVFLKDLIAQYQRFISIIKEDKGPYVLSFKNIAEEIKEVITSPSEYSQVVMPLFYEYIRGAFHNVQRGELRYSISQLSNKLNLVCTEGGKVNFKDIFNPAFILDDSRTNLASSLLTESYQLGDKYIDADAITNILHSVVCHGHEHEGEVPTDVELGVVLMQLLKSIGGELKECERIMDPAAGSGNLISSAISVFDELKLSQIIVNDVNKKLLQLLSLRLGLKFPATVSKENSPLVKAVNIASLPKKLFTNVRYIALNPPFLASTAIDCSKRKQSIYNRIHKLTGRVATTIKGQMPLEGPFLELVGDLAEENTIIACILPHTHFTARGEASASIRQMLLGRFGLYMIFNYPQAKLFDDVVQNTAIAIGIVGKQSEDIKYLYSNSIICDVDVSKIPSVMSKEFQRNNMCDLGDNFDGMIVSRKDLVACIDMGWSIFNMSKQDAATFINSNLVGHSKLRSTSDCNIKIYRGKIGNSGGSDLLYYRSKKLLEEYVDSLSQHTGAAGLRNADYEYYHVGKGHVFLDVSGIEDDMLTHIIDFYKSNIENNNTRQRRDVKSIDDYKNLIKSESRKSVPIYSILAPRAIRTNASIFVCDEETFVSTNFFVFEMYSEEQAYIYSSWMLSVFFQLECEVVSKNNAGLRKMELTEYRFTQMPDYMSLTDEEKSIIVNDVKNGVVFLNLRNPQIRNIDVIWAKLLFGDNYKEKLDEAISLLAILAANREI